MNDPLDRLRPPPGLRMLITAGASGIGRCIAEGFTAAGAQVALCDIDSDALEAVRTTLLQAIVRLADVADEDAAAALAGSREAAVDVVLRTMLPYFGPRSSTLVGRRERADETLVERMNASMHQSSPESLQPDERSQGHRRAVPRSKTRRNAATQRYRKHPAGDRGGTFRAGRANAGA